MALLRSCSHYLHARLSNNRGGAPFGLLEFVGGSVATHQHCSNNVTLNRQLHQVVTRQLHRPTLPLSSWKELGANSLLGGRFIGTHYYAAESISWCHPHEDVNNNRPHSLFHAQPSASKIQLQLQSCRHTSTTSSTFHSDQRRQQPKRGFIDMKKQPTIETVADVTFKQLNILQPATLAAFWNRVSQLMTQRHDRKRTPKNQHFDPDQQEQLQKQLNAIFHKTMGDMKKFGPKDLSQTVVGFAKISIELESSRGRRSTELSYPILSDLVIGINSQQKDMIFQTIANVSIRQLPNFDAQGLANLAHANAKAVLNPVVGDGRTLFHHIAEKSVPRLKSFNSQDLANMVWSFEKVGAHNPKLFEGVAKAVCSMNDLGQFKPQGLSNILLAYVKAGQSNSMLFEKIADHIVENCNLNEFNSQDFANTLTAYVKAGQSNPMLFKKVADHIVENCNLDDFEPQHLANTVWSYATARESNPVLFKKVADHITDNCSLHLFDPQALSNTVWAFAKAKEPNPTMFDKVANHILSLDNLDSFISKHCAQLLESFANANIIHVPLFMKVADHAMNNIDFSDLDKEDQHCLLVAFIKAENARKESEETKGDDDSSESTPKQD